jgi:hypothetical protein
MAGIIVEVGAALDAEPRAVIPTHGLEWQTKHHLVAEQRLEVDEIALNRLARSSSHSMPG